ncbi:MAG: response regulator transcription factor [Atopobiaceae bacterium]|nr:response regulator transcription factor [Atopobiaceae bacterium]
MRILLAEDERQLARALVAILEHEDYVVDVANDGEEALYLLSCNDYDVCVLDIMMPKVDGLTVLRQMRDAGNYAPVMLLTAKGEIRDRVIGLDSGANDYLTKPFSAAELLARLRALTRPQGAVGRRVLQVGDLSLDLEARTLSCKGTSLEVLGRELQMMEMLMSHPNERISTERFLRTIWGGLSDVESSVVWVNLSNLRKKLKKLSSQVRIVTVRGVGYQLEVADD